MKRYLFVLLLLALVVSAANAEVIKFKSGKIREGRIVERTDEYIKLDLGIDVNLTYYLDDIETIDSKPVVQAKEHRREERKVVAPKGKETLTQRVTPPVKEAPKPVQDKEPENKAAQSPMDPRKLIDQRYLEAYFKDIIRLDQEIDIVMMYTEPTVDSLTNGRRQLKKTLLKLKIISVPPRAKKFHDLYDEKYKLLVESLEISADSLEKGPSGVAKNENKIIENEVQRQKVMESAEIEFNNIMEEYEMSEADYKINFRQGL